MFRICSKGITKLSKLNKNKKSYAQRTFEAFVNHELLHASSVCYVHIILQGRGESIGNNARSIIRSSNGFPTREIFILKKSSFESEQKRTIRMSEI